MSTFSASPLPPVSPQTIQPSVSTLPLEIQQLIVYWVNKFLVQDLEDSNATYKPASPSTSLPSLLPSSIDSSQDALQNGGLPASIPPLQNVPDQEPSALSFSPSACSSSWKPRSSLFALSMVNKTFYQLCAPFIWHGIDCGPIDDLKFILDQVLPRHNNHVRSLWWRVSYECLREEGVRLPPHGPHDPTGAMDNDDERVSPVWWNSPWEIGDHETKNVPTEFSDWDQVIRARLLHRILELCPRLNKLDIDLQYNDTGLQAEALEPSRFELWPTGQLLEPLSRLTSLTRLALTAPGLNSPFREDMLVRVIRDLRALESFSCTSIASPLEPSETSILATELATLPMLNQIQLAKAECVDWSWTKVNWRGRIKGLSLQSCSRVSTQVLHALVEQFASTLVELDLVDVPSLCDRVLDWAHAGMELMYSQLEPEEYETQVEVIHAWRRMLLGAWREIRDPLESGRLVFRLPKLKVLLVGHCLRGAGFLRAFMECKSLAIIETGGLINCEEMSELVVKNVWPSLTHLSVYNHSEVGGETLRAYCAEKGIEITVKSLETEETGSGFED